MLNTAQILQAQLKQAGIDLQLETVDHQTFHANIRKDLSGAIYYTAARFPVADVYLTQFFHSRSIVGTPTAVTNFSHCDVADKEIEAARTEPDLAKQKELWATAQTKIVEEVCAVPLFEQLQVWAHKTNSTTATSSTTRSISGRRSPKLTTKKYSFPVRGDGRVLLRTPLASGGPAPAPRTRGAARSSSSGCSLRCRRCGRC